MKSNKLIAEFMGLETSDGCYFEHLTKEGNRELTHHILLKYHTSWDWLMPVVETCYHNGAEENEVGDITHALLDCNRDHLYISVVEFINQYNKTI
ncbi:hypothetical protein N9Q25_00415 [bacterium]|nr:hypothetical protein [bacterium]